LAFIIEKSLNVIDFLKDFVDEIKDMSKMALTSMAVIYKT